MKKFVVGIVIGFMLALPFTPAGAEVTSLIGKTIEGQFPVFVDGEQIENPAIVIDGVSYLPGRAVAEMFNADVAFVDRKILVSPQGGLYMTGTEQETHRQRMSDEAAAEEAALQEQTRIKNELNTMTRDLEQIQYQITRFDERIQETESHRDELLNAYLEGEGKTEEDEPYVRDEENFNRMISDLEQRRDEMQQKYDDLQAEIEAFKKEHELE